MRQIFYTMPYVCPKEPDDIAALIRQHGTLKSVTAGEVLKRAGDANRLFLLEEGVCGYFVAGEASGHAAVMSLLLPGTTMGDMTASVGRRCNVETKAILPSKVWVTSPDFYENYVFTVPELATKKYMHAVAKQEATLEGMIANFTLPPEQRVKILFKALLTSAGCWAESGWMRVPYGLSAEVIGQTVNLTRQSVTQTIGEWRRRGLAQREGRHLILEAAIFEDIYDWLEHREASKPDWPTE